MKKFVSLVLVLLMIATASLCFAEDATGSYTIYNMTGETLTELYLYPVGSEDKGENLAANLHGNKGTFEYTAPEGTMLVIEFTTESNYNASFNNLAIEVAPITLLAADAMTGATPISFAVPEGTGSYDVYNMTGESLSELYIYPTGSEDKGENLVTSLHGNKGTLTYTASMDQKLTIEFTTESGYNAAFDNLSIEVAPITLLAADAMTGATPISFTVPEGTGSYDVYNMTGESLSELYIYPTGSEDKGENLVTSLHGNKGTLTYTAAMNQKLTIEFTTESGYNAAFDTLSIEVAPITLLAADAMTGATPISFTVPEGTGSYNVYNMTGESLSELYIYPTGSEDKGENLVTSLHGNKGTLTYTATMNQKLTIEFTTESGYNAAFDTLSIEVAPITLLAADAMTGATPISFTVPEGTGAYTLYNLTGEELAELYLYAVGSEDKGENLAASFEDGIVLTYTAPLNQYLVLEFVTADGYTGLFETLAIETAPISLLSSDAMTGATAISFTAPEN